MSRIADVQTIVVGTPWRELTLVEVVTDNGVSGLGEVRMVNKTDTLVACISELADRYLIGSDPFDTAKLAWNVQVAEYGTPGELTQSALAAMDVACWDIMGKELGVPVWKLLGGRFRERIPAYANGWYRGDRDPALIAELAGGVLERGYRAMKIDPFGAAAGELPLAERRCAAAILEAVRERVGPDVELFVEMHGRFTAATALEVIGDMRHLEVGWFEEPLPPEDVTGLAHLRRLTDVRIAAGERMYRIADLVPFLGGALVDVLQVDVTHHAGLTGMQRLAGWALAANLVMAPHNVCGPIGTAAALHLGVALPNFKILEHFNDFADPWVQDLVTAAPTVDPEDGCFALPTEPGLGFELRHDVCAQHPRTRGRLELFSEGWEKRAEPDRTGR